MCDFPRRAFPEVSRNLNSASDCLEGSIHEYLAPNLPADHQCQRPKKYPDSRRQASMVNRLVPTHFVVAHLCPALAVGSIQSERCNGDCRNACPEKTKRDR